MHPNAERRRLRLYFWLYLGFVVYGSLIPFQYRPLSFAQALENFQHLAYLNLGPGSRADWIANILLYIPLAFLGCGALLGLRRPPHLPLPALVGVFAACLGIAVGVEFVQQFFAPRTVSLNDLIAETLGSLGGIVLWRFGRGFLVRPGESFAAGGRDSIRAAAATYALLYGLLALFPYDLVLSGDELAAHLRSGNVGWLVADGCGGLLRCGARLGVEVAALVPLGLLLGILAPGLGPKRLALTGLLLGGILELLQLFLISATAQGVSLLTRAGGLLAGGLLAVWLRQRGVTRLAIQAAALVPWLALPYGLLVLAVNAWFSDAWLSFTTGLHRLPGLHLTPLYYHYYSTEPAAMASLLANLALYAPVGVALWCRRRAARLPERGGARAAALLALLFALPVELGKLWLAHHHPDPTNWLIAAGAAALSYGATAWLARALDGRAPAMPLPASPPATAAPPSALAPRSLPGLVIAGIALGIGLLSHPYAGFWTIVLAGYGLLLWNRPLAWLGVVPFTLPLLDLASFEGRLWLDEFDLLVLTTLVVAPLRLRQPPCPWPGRAAKWAVSLLWLSWLAASARGLRGLDPAGDLYGAYSPLAAWQVGKGLLWALCLVPLLRRVPVAQAESGRRIFFHAVVAALAAEVFVVVWERYRFVGLTDFDNVFRVTGTFASMQTGGAYLEAFLAFGFPFLLVWTLYPTRPWIRWPGLVLAALATYAMLVTFARGGYAGMAVATLTALAGARRQLSRQWLIPAALTVLLALVCVPILSDGFARYRLQRSPQDLAVRWHHWRQALRVMDEGVWAQLFGSGFGRYPRNYLLYGDYPLPPGGYVIHRQGRQHFLQLLPGESVYLDQRVAVRPHTPYRLQARVRVQAGGEALTVPLCEKALLYSFRCRWQRLQPTTPGRWETLTTTILSGDLGDGLRPVKLSLYNAGKHPVDVDDVHLLAPDGDDLLANGDFENGDRFWLFVTDRDLAWHIHQAGIEVYFAQGWLGLAGLGLLLYATVRRLIPGWRRTDPWALACLGALTGFVTVSLTGSTMDGARGMMLLYLLCFSALVPTLLPISSRNHKNQFLTRLLRVLCT